VADLDFTSEYSLVAFKTDYLHAIVGWFETSFNHGSQKVVLSTSADRPNTHWKQAVFYIDDEVAIKKGEKLNGSILVKKDTKNPRELNIKISYHLHEENRDFDGTQYYKFA